MHHTFNRAALDTFKAQWPCHGLPDSLNALTFEFDASGDLIDIEAKSRNGRTLDSAEFDGAAMVALSEDAKALAQKPVTPVLFRVHRAPASHGAEVTAVFPCEPSDMTGNTMTCYAHIGQHGGCDYGWYNSTRAAKPAEYEALKRELESAPYSYRLQVYKRMQPAHRDTLRAEVSRLRKLS